MRMVLLTFLLPLSGLPAVSLAQFDPDPASPAWYAASERRLVTQPAVASASGALLEATLSGIDAAALIDRFQDLRRRTALSPALRDAILFDFVQRLRERPPQSAPVEAIEWLASREPLAVTGHEEGPHHAVALFNLNAAATGLINQWRWHEGYDAVAGPNSPPTGALARRLAHSDTNSPAARGMRHAIDRLPAARLDALARACAASPGGCGALRADVELARGNLEWLTSWMRMAPAGEVMPRLQRARRLLDREAGDDLMERALAHSDPGVAAWAMSDITSHLPKNRLERREWGTRLVKMLSDLELGSAAALQLARLESDVWLEAAAAEALDERVRRRLELMVEMEGALHTGRPDREVRP